MNEKPAQPNRGKRITVTTAVGAADLKKVAEILASEPERVQKALRDVQAVMAPLVRAVRDSEQLSQSDFAIRINARA